MGDINAADSLNGTEQLTGNQAADPSPAATPAPKAEDTAEYWRSKYNGREGFATSQKKRADDLAVEKDILARAFEEEKVRLETEAAAAKAEALEAKTRATQAEQEKSTLARQREIGKLIRTEFPGLADLYEAELLIGVEKLEGDALKTFLARYQDTLGDREKAGVQNKLAGSTPSPASQTAGTTVTPDAFKTQLSKVLRDKGVNSPEYQTLFQDYLNSLVPAGAS